MTTAEHHTRYLNLPMPSHWQSILEPLLPAQAPDLPYVDLPESGTLIDLCLTPGRKEDGGRFHDLLWQRLVQGRSSESVAADYRVSYQRVGGIQRDALVRARSRGQTLLQTLKRQINREGTIVRASGHSARWPAASGADQWKLLAALLHGPTFAVRPLSGNRSADDGNSASQALCGRALCGAPAALNIRKAQQRLRDVPRYWPLADLAAATGCAEITLRAAADLGSTLRLTAGGLVMRADWHHTELLTALALELQAAGVHAWHFSEIARAANLVDPLRTLTHRNAATVIQRVPDIFATAGPSGHWRLARPEDRDPETRTRTTRAAITGVLRASDLPLHAQVIHQELMKTRDCRFATVEKTLIHDPAFRCYGRNVYALTGRDLPPLPEETWAAAHLATMPSGTLTSQQMRGAALQAGVDPARLETIARFSTQVQLRGKTSPAYCSERASLERDYLSWYHNRTVRPHPMDRAALQYTLSLPPTPVQSKHLLEIRAVYRSNGWDFPAELTGEGH